MNPLPSLLARVIVPRLLRRVSERMGVRLPPALADEMVDETMEAIEADPQIKNELNQESPIQSRVAWGAIIAAVGVVAPMLARLFGLNITEDQVAEVGGAIVTLFGAAYVLYGRFASFSAPLFERWRS